MTTTAHPTLADRLGTGTREPVERDRPAAIDSCRPLGDLLHAIAIADRAHLAAVQLLVDVQHTAEIDDTTGVPLERWLEQYGRLPRTDRRMYATAATVLRHMPATMAAWSRHAVSWGQVRTIVLATKDLPKRYWPDMDQLLAAESNDFTDADPDVLLGRVRRAVFDLRPDKDEQADTAIHRDRFLSIQRSLLDDGVAKIYGEGPDVSVGAIADALDQLLDAPDSSSRTRDGGDVDPASSAVRTQGRRRFDALVWLATSFTGEPLPEDEPDHPVDLLAKAKVPLSLTVTCDLETLLGLAERSGDLVTTLSGGTLRVSASTARRLAALAGRIRLLVTDSDGQVLGVGTKTRVAPGWLVEAIRTMFPTSIGPGSRTSARHCDLDHHVEWQDDGPTDIANLAPVDRRFHTAKTRGDWSITTRKDGSRKVTHHASGWTQTIIPATRPFGSGSRGDPPR